MQLTGNRFTSETASFGNDLSTLPNFPAEIRAPTGTLPGVSSFQLHFADHDIMTPGDAPDVLVVMNPAALKANLADLPGGGLLIADADEFTPRNLAKVGYATNPLEDGSLEGWQLVSVPLTSMTLDALADSGLGKKEAERSKNMFTLGLLSWMYHRPTEGTSASWSGSSAASRRSPRPTSPPSARATTTARRRRPSPSPTRSSPPRWRRAATATSPATRRSRSAWSPPVSARACRSSSAPTRSRRPRTSSTSCPSTRRFGVRTFQAEDEIAGIGAALGASFGGALA